MKHFDVSDFIRQDNKILVNIEKDNILIPITIPQDKFETFLLVTDKLQWEMNYSEAGEHQQRTGTMSYLEYWDQDADIIENDLYEYITSHPINYKGQVYTNPVQQLNISFQLAVLKRTTQKGKVRVEFKNWKDIVDQFGLEMAKGFSRSIKLQVRNPPANILTVDYNPAKTDAFLTFQLVSFKNNTALYEYTGTAN